MDRHSGVSCKKWWVSPKWMVKRMENTPIFLMDDLGGYRTPILGNTHIHRWITIPFINLKPWRSARYRYRIAASLHESPPPSSGVFVPGVCGAKKCRESRNDRNHHPNGGNPDRGPMDQVAKEGGGGVGERWGRKENPNPLIQNEWFQFFPFLEGFFFPDPKNGVTVTASFFNHRFFLVPVDPSKRTHVGLMAWKGLDEDEWNWQHQVDCGCNWHQGNLAGTVSMGGRLPHDCEATGNSWF